MANQAAWIKAPFRRVRSHSARQPRDITPNLHDLTSDVAAKDVGVVLEVRRVLLDLPVHGIDGYIGVFYHYFVVLGRE